MLYKIVRPLAKIAIRCTFRKIYFTNEERIPWDKPIILAINHPTSFIEPCLLATHLEEPLHFLARGDLFKKPFYAKLLNGVHILPIFRMKDGGYGKIKNNFSTLEKCFEAIHDGKTILIMAEGNCIQEKRLRPLRKGTARLAFGTLERYRDMDIQIVPVGVNYTYPDDFRSEIMLDFGHPIAVQDYLPKYDVHPQEAIRAITAELDKRLRKRIVIIDNKNEETFTESLLQQYRNNNTDPVLPIIDRQNDQRLQGEIEVAQQINVMDNDKKKRLKETVKEYEQELNQLSVEDWGVANPKFPTTKAGLILLLGLLPFLIGYAGNYIPVKYAQYFKNKKVKDVEDKMSVGICIGIGGLLLYYILLTILCIVSGAIKWLWFIILLPFWGYFSLVYKDYFFKWKAVYRLNQLSDATRTTLTTKRKVIQSYFA